MFSAFIYCVLFLALYEQDLELLVLQPYPYTSTICIDMSMTNIKIIENNDKQLRTDAKINADGVGIIW